jgi:hypothetical protein
VDEVKIQVLQAQIIQSFLASHLDMFWRMECIPELTSHVKVSTTTKVCFESSPDAFPNLEFFYKNDLNFKCKPPET